MNNYAVWKEFASSAILGVVSMSVSCKLIKGCMGLFMSKNVVGRDLAKKDKPAIPEAMGVVVGMVYLVVAIQGQYIFGSHAGMCDFHGGLLSVAMVLLLGFMDDILDLRWRYKMFIPLVAITPLLATYSGTTSISLKLVPLDLGYTYMDIGTLYYAIMGIIAVFCTNSINIYAGLNGLEAGQSLIISFFIMLYNIIVIYEQCGIGSCYSDVSMRHLISLVSSSPFFGSTLGLLFYNWHPSRVFGGDSYTYFAGMHFAVVGIQGHFSRTLLLFFLPQMANFILSLPQLLNFIPCPRHRVPRFADSLLHDSGNYTLINMVLKVTGPMSEPRLVSLLLLVQAVSCALGLVCRRLYHSIMVA